MCNCKLSLVHLLKHGRLEPARQLLFDCQYRDLEQQEDAQDGTALHWACSRGYLDIVEALLTLGAKCNTGTKCGLTPLHCACAHGYLQIVRTLLEWGADVTSRSDCGDTPCHVAAYRGQADVLCLLVRYGANPLLVNCQGRDALAEALANHHSETVRLLRRISGHGFNRQQSWPQNGCVTIPSANVTVTSDPESLRHYERWQELGRQLSLDRWHQQWCQQWRHVTITLHTYWLLLLQPSIRYLRVVLIGLVIRTCHRIHESVMNFKPSLLVYVVVILSPSWWYNYEVCKHRLAKLNITHYHTICSLFYFCQTTFHHRRAMIHVYFYVLISIGWCAW